jgi:hypothetical protein
LDLVVAAKLKETFGMQEGLSFLLGDLLGLFIWPPLAFLPSLINARNHPNLVCLGHVMRSSQTKD